MVTGKREEPGIMAKRECEWCSREIIQTQEHTFVGTRFVDGKPYGTFMHTKCYKLAYEDKRAD